MATRIKTNKKPGKGGKIALGVFAALILLLLVTVGISMINANLLRIRRAEVVIGDLPQGLDDITLLYASDIDLCGLNTPDRAGAVFDQLQSLHPDLLILGGDYNSTALLDMLNQSSNDSVDESRSIESRSRFFHYINAFQSPLGKYAIATTEDVQWQNLKDVMAENGIQSLINEKIKIDAGGDTLWLAGICGKVSSLYDAGSTFASDDCVIAIAEGPDLLPVMLTSEAADSGPWADLILCGSTHGGQIRLFGRSVLSLSYSQQHFLSGWYTQGNIPILTTEGLGCEGLNLRLGSEPEVWLITLRRE